MPTMSMSSGEPGTIGSCGISWPMPPGVTSGSSPGSASGLVATVASTQPCRPYSLACM